MVGWSSTPTRWWSRKIAASFSISAFSTFTMVEMTRLAVTVLSMANERKRARYPNNHETPVPERKCIFERGQIMAQIWGRIRGGDNFERMGRGWAWKGSPIHLVWWCHNPTNSFQSNDKQEPECTKPSSFRLCQWDTSVILHSLYCPYQKNVKNPIQFFVIGYIGSMDHCVTADFCRMLKEDANPCIWLGTEMLFNWRAKRRNWPRRFSKPLDVWLDTIVRSLSTLQS